MTYRKLNRGDVVEFQRLRLFGLRESPAAFGSSFEESSVLSRQSFESMLDFSDADGAVQGAFDGGRLVGVGGLKRETRLKEKHKGIIWGLYVDPEFRNRGVAREIMQRLVEQARAMTDLVFVKLTVLASNEPAKRLYEKLDFIKFGCEPKALLIEGKLFDEDYMLLALEPEKSAGELAAAAGAARS
jgi:ribosomal protein S18 acetylase RimI-like enzyme